MLFCIPGRRLALYIYALSVSCLLLLVIFTGCSPDDSLTQEEKQEDFEHLYQVIIENYPFLEVNKRMHGVDWEANHQSYLQKIGAAETDIQFFEALQSILSDLNDGHAHMLNGENVYEFRKTYGNFLVEYPKDWRRMLFDNLNHDVACKRYGLEPLELGQDNSPQQEAVQQNPVSSAQVQDIVEDKVGCIHIPQMLTAHMREKDEILIGNYLEEVKDYQALVIDIRGNGGGDSRYWQDFLVPRLIDRDHIGVTYSFYKDGTIAGMYPDFRLEHSHDLVYGQIKDLDLTMLPMLPPEVEETFTHYIKSPVTVKPIDDSISFPGNIYLLVDGIVYSSAESFAVFAKDTGFAILIGDKTGGGGIGTDSWVEMLPNSGYIFRFPVEMGTSADGTVNQEHATTPDYKPSGEPPFFLDDPFLHKVLELEGLSDRSDCSNARG